jgi:hypothetical protein
MPLYFFVHNFHFALELMGAVAFLMAGWLTFDTYFLKKDAASLLSAVGLALLALFQVAHVTAEGDVLAYVASLVLLLGLALIAGSFLKNQELKLQAVVVIPAFTLWGGYLSLAAALLFIIVAYLSYRRSHKEMNKALIPFALAFFALGVGAALGFFKSGNEISAVFIVEHLFKLAGFLFLVQWVWQYLQLRIRESMVLIFISAALFLSTVVTLAFSTILIGQITAETERNLLTDVKVLNLHIEALKEESWAKASLIASDSALKEALVANDFSHLEQLTEGYMENYKLGFVTVTDKDGNVLVRAHALSRRGDSLLGERALEDALNGSPFVTIEESPVEKLSIRAGAPIFDKRLIVGTVIAGYPLDNALVDSIKRLTGLEMFIYTKDVSIAATALAADGRTRVTGFPLKNSAVTSAVLVAGELVTAEANLYGKTFLASYLPLKNGDGKIIGMLSAAKPQDELLALENTTNRLTLVTVLIIMFTLIYPIYLLTKRLTEE